MKTHYTTQHIDQFFKLFNELHCSYGIEKVHQLINNPQATAGLKVKYKNKPFKFLIMSSIIFLSFLALVFTSIKEKALNNDLNSSITESFEDNINLETKKLQQATTVLKSREQIQNVSKREYNRELKTTLPVVKSDSSEINQTIKHSQTIEKKANNNNLDVTKPEESKPKSNETVLVNDFNWEQRIIKLTREQLVVMGFVMKNNQIRYGWKHGKKKTEITFYRSGGYGVNTNATFVTPVNNLEPVFLSDRAGMQNLKWKYDSDNKKWTSAYFIEKIQYLIPIIISKEDYPNLQKDFIFWFEPSDRLFELLPKELGEDIKNEYTLITQPKMQLKVNPKNSGCTYFEACQSTLNLINFKVYPNPASSSTTIDFELEKDVTGSVILTSISGIKVKSLISEVIFKSGENSFDINLTDIQEGIYLLYITTPQGFKTQRIIILR